MPHSLPTLPYALNALEPYIDAMTMEIHSQKHHKAYVDNLNKALEGTGLESLDIVTLLRDLSKVPADKKAAVVNNGGGHHNHALFWTVMGPNTGGEPTGAVGDAINSVFGDFSKFRETFKQNALTQFGSGWSWLVYDSAAATIKAIKKPNQDSPLMDGQVPLLGCDIWEHAYYLKYQNKRADYVDAWWNVVNWKKVDELYGIAKAGM